MSPASSWTLLGCVLAFSYLCLFALMRVASWASREEEHNEREDR